MRILPVLAILLLLAPSGRAAQDRKVRLRDELAADREFSTAFLGVHVTDGKGVTRGDLSRGEAKAGRTTRLTSLGDVLGVAEGGQ